MRGVSVFFATDEGGSEPLGARPLSSFWVLRTSLTPRQSLASRELRAIALLGFGRQFEADIGVTRPLN
jgi:hypothetical protein